MFLLTFLYISIYNNNVCRLFEKDPLTVLEARVLENYRTHERIGGIGGRWDTYIGTLGQFGKRYDNYYSTLWIDGNCERDGEWVYDIYRSVRFRFRRPCIVGTYNIIKSH